ncbi:MAG: DNA-processing protein DprA [Bacteroides sp.]|nr:DNA-processing protein DprA [Bacteroides sp.]MCM1413702.1 DNA-processing protein DprA [Bacteroides sp.]MCM1471881.1 DNA-processing protein DprA [Bacteroides sp.]
METPDDLKYKIAFASLRGINPLVGGEYLARVGDERCFFEATQRQLSAMMGFSNRLFDEAYRSQLLERAEQEVAFIRKSDVKPVYFTSESYPQRLLEAEDAPLMLYKLGGADCNSPRMISIVGTRHATAYGRDYVERLIEDLKNRLAEPPVIVSGLALGIDGMAHAAALRCGLPTIGVLAHGLNMIYPSQHRDLAANMVRNGGGLLTEYGSHAPVHKGNFVARNRIVAAMTDCTIVVESAKKGGALITARLASDYHRDVFALPGRTSDRYSAGCNDLINRNVAMLIRDCDDLIEAMNWPVKDSVPEQPTLFAELSEPEQQVVDLLTEVGEMAVNQMAIKLNINIGRLMSLLIDMEFKGLIIAFPGSKYRLS